MSDRAFARQAEVSASTVSLALRNSPKIPEKTKRRIREMARREGYRPNVKVTELTSEVRSSRRPRTDACFGAISFYGNNLSPPAQ